MSSVNEIPNGWIKTTIGELVELAQGVAINAKTKHVLSNEDEGIPLLKINNLINDTIDQYANPNLVPEKSIIHKNDVIFTRTGQVGEVFKNKFGILHNNSFKVIPNEKLHWSYLYWYLKDRRVYNYVQKVAAGSVQKDLNHGAFKTIEFKYPKVIEEQKAIANILTAFDDKIENLQAQNKTLEQTAQTIFKERFKNESEDWERVKINELVEISSSKRIFHSEYVDDGIPFYRGKEIIELSTKPDISTELFITEERYNEIKEKHLVPTKGDILLTAVGTLGVPFQVRNYKPFYFKDGNLIWFKNFSNKMSSDFLYNWLKLKTTQNQLNTISIGSTQKALTITSIKELEIPLILDKEKREIFDKVLSSNLNKVNHNLAQIQTLKQTRDTVLPKLMSGQLRVNAFKA